MISSKPRLLRVFRPKQLLWSLHHVSESCVTPLCVRYRPLYIDLWCRASADVLHGIDVSYEVRTHAVICLSCVLSLLLWCFYWCVTLFFIVLSCKHRSEPTRLTKTTEEPSSWRFYQELHYKELLLDLHWLKTTSVSTVSVFSVLQRQKGFSFNTIWTRGRPCKNKTVLFSLLLSSYFLLFYLISTFPVSCSTFLYFYLLMFIFKLGGNMRISSQGMMLHC